MNSAVLFETRSGVRVTGFTDVGFSGSHRGTCGLGVLLNVGRRPPSWLAVSGTANVLISIPRVHYTTRHVTDPSSSAGTLELIHIHIHHTSDRQPPLPPQDPGDSRGSIVHSPGGPHTSLSPPSRTVVEPGALWAK